MEQGMEQGTGKGYTGASNAPRHEYSDEFETIWLKYPQRAGSNPKIDAYRAFKATLKRGADIALVDKGLDRYIRFCKATRKIGTETVLQTKTFFGPSERWKEEWTLPRQGAAISTANDDAIDRALGTH